MNSAANGHAPAPGARGRPWGLLITAPYVLYLVAFLVIPFANILVISFYTYSPIKAMIPDLTVDNYLRMADGYYIEVFLRTLKIGLYTTVVCVLLGYPVAYHLARATPRVATIGLFLLITPLMVSTVIRVFGWLVVLGRRGLANQTLVALGFEPVRLLNTEFAVVLGLVQMFLPFTVLPLMAAIERVPPSVEEAAMNLGAGWTRTFLKVVVPLSVPGLISGCLLTYTLSISAFVTPALLGGTRVRMIGQQIYDDVLASFHWPGASAIALVVVTITVVVLYLGLRATARLARQEAFR